MDGQNTIATRNRWPNMSRCWPSALFLLALCSSSCSPSNEREQRIRAEDDFGATAGKVLPAGPAHLGDIVVSSVPMLGRSTGDTIFRVVMTFDRPARFVTTQGVDRKQQTAWVKIRIPSCNATAKVPAHMQVGTGGIKAIFSRSQPPDATEVLVLLEPGTRHRASLLAEPFRLELSFFGQAAPSKIHSHSNFTVMIDPGHGGSDTGAKGPKGERESRLALDIAQRLRASLQQRQPKLLVLMTRETDEPMALEKRAEVANRFDADVFVSIHLNAMDNAKEGGAATFVLDTSDDRHSLRLAARENGVSESQVSGLQAVVASLQRHHQMPRSELLARSIQTQLLAHGRKHVPHLQDRGMRRALFFVLAAVHMPAVLVEASFLTNPQEASMLRTRRYRAALAEGLADGIINYLRLPQSG